TASETAAAEAATTRTATRETVVAATSRAAAIEVVVATTASEAATREAALAPTEATTTRAAAVTATAEAAMPETAVTTTRPPARPVPRTATAEAAPRETALTITWWTTACTGVRETAVTLLARAASTVTAGRVPHPGRSALAVLATVRERHARSGAPVGSATRT